MGSKIIIYGAGNVGKDFYTQLYLVNNNPISKKYFIEAWIDKSFDAYELNKPFDYVKNINNHEFDYIVIAVSNKKAANEIKDELKKNNVPDEKIIWSESYRFIGRDVLPKDTTLLINNFPFYNDILNEYTNDKSGFGGAQFYQSFKKIGFDGQRNTEARIELYNIKNFLNKSDVVLDIGCNCGFLDMQVASYVKKVVGYEISPSLVDIANKVSKFLNINNVEFHCEDFTANKHIKTYNAVFAFAIHTWLVTEMFAEEDFVDLIYNLLENEGYLFFESNNMRDCDGTFKKLCSMFVERGMKICLHKNLSDTYRSDIIREIVVLQKN